MITCQICNKPFKLITKRHLVHHNITREEYIAKFPGALQSEESSALRAAKSKIREEFLTEEQRKARNEKISSNRKGITSWNKGKTDYKLERSEEAKARVKAKGAWNKGKSISEEQKTKQSKIMLERYASGAVHWNTGNTVSLETSSKISESLKAYALQESIRLLPEREKLKAKKNLVKCLKLVLYKKSLDSKLLERNVKLLDHKNDYVTLQCTNCLSIWKLTNQYIDDSRISKIVCRTCTPKLSSSLQEKELSDFIKSLIPEVIENDRLVLGGKEIDVLIENKKIGFEFNGLYWHSELVRGSPKHLLWKQQHAWKKGYKLYHIFSDEWENKQDIVKSRIKMILGVNQIKLDARKLSIVKLSSIEKQQFLIENHLQGGDVSGIRYGLKNEHEIVACMTFKKTSYVKGGNGEEFELNRFATKQGIQIRGGAGKLLKSFIREYSPKSLISYADRRWSFGDLYLKLGFKFESQSTPSYWYMKNHTEREHRSVYMKHKLVAEGNPSNLTEWEIMKTRGYDRIWDCGTLKYRLDF